MKNLNTTQKKVSGPKITLIGIGILSLAWFLIRIIPKPSRAYYPCQRAAFPFATAFVMWLLSFTASFFAFKRAKVFFRKSGYVQMAIFLIAGIILYGISLISAPGSVNATYAKMAYDDFVPTDNPNEPMGTARGIFPGRVCWVHQPEAIDWDGTENWWKDKFNDQHKIDEMLSNSIQWLTGTENDKAAWDSIFIFFNRNHDKGATKYIEGEKIAVKLNLNQCGDYTAANKSFTSPHLVMSLTKQLVEIVGIKENDISFFDANRLIPDPIYDKIHAQYPGVRFVGEEESKGRSKHERDLDMTIPWSQDLTLEAESGYTAYLPTCLSEADYFINLASFKGHNYAGVTFCGKNNFGSFCAGEPGTKSAWNAPKAAGLHPYMTVHDFITGSWKWTFYERPMESYNSIVDLMGHEHVGEKTLLFMIDAFYGTPDEHIDYQNSIKWKMAPFNDDWTSSLFVSLDGVAIESVGLDFYRTEQQINDEYTKCFGNVDNYLHEAALANNPPSGKPYDPERDGTACKSLGVHEHWNNEDDKQYSANLGTDNGIELIWAKPALIKAPSDLTILQKTTDVVEFSWTDNSDNEDKFIIERAVNDSLNFVVHATVPAGSSSFMDEEVDNGNMYYYRIRALSNGINSTYSEPVKVSELETGTSGIQHDTKMVDIYVIGNEIWIKNSKELRSKYAQLSLISLDGRLILKKDIVLNEHETRIDLNTQISGFVIVSIQSDKFSISQKIYLR